MRAVMYCGISHIQLRASVFALFTMVLAFHLQAQNLNIRGRVIDANGQPVARVTALLLKNRGTDSTNSHGNFAIAATVGIVTAGSAIDRGTIAFALRNNNLLIENSRSSAFGFDVVSIEGRRVHALKRQNLPAG